MSMVVACVGYQDGRRVADLDIARCGSFLDGAGRFVWIGLYEPSEELLRTVQRQFGLHDLACTRTIRRTGTFWSRRFGRRRAQATSMP
jgi:Mg2+ and Co2+ transporter CorA